MPLKIKLVGNWFLLSDAHNIIIAKEDNGRVVGVEFYNKIEDALEGFIRMKIKGFDSKSMEELIEDLKALQMTLNKALRPLQLRVEVGK